MLHDALEVIFPVTHNQTNTKALVTCQPTNWGEWRWNKYQEIGMSRAMTEQAKVIGANVKRLRKKHGLSQQALADKIGVKSQNTIAAIESGDTQKSRYLGIM